MVGKSFFPSKVWTFALWSSALVSGMVFALLEGSWEVLLMKSVFQIIFGYTIGLLFYFLWTRLGQWILKTVDNYFRKKIAFNMMAVAICILIGIILIPWSGSYERTYQIFDYFTFGILLIAGTWLYAIEYEFPEGDPNVLDDIFEAL